jgi:hypothetical protein
MRAEVYKFLWSEAIMLTVSIGILYWARPEVTFDRYVIRISPDGSFWKANEVCLRYLANYYAARKPEFSLFAALARRATCCSNIAENHFMSRNASVS